MRQGKANPDGRSGGKREPISHGVNYKAVSQIGQTLGNKTSGNPNGIHDVAENLYGGRGYKAPKLETTIHHGGSQGRR